MRENEAIDLALRLHDRHIISPSQKDTEETTVIQNIADLYKAGYELVPGFKPNISISQLEKMKEEGVAY